jgi:hypothetical protein
VRADSPFAFRDVVHAVQCRRQSLIPKSLHDKIDRFLTGVSRVTRISRADAMRQLIDYGVGPTRTAQGRSWLLSGMRRCKAASDTSRAILICTCRIYRLASSRPYDAI